MGSHSGYAGIYWGSLGLYGYIAPIAGVKWTRQWKTKLKLEGHRECSALGVGTASLTSGYPGRTE